MPNQFPSAPLDRVQELLELDLIASYLGQCAALSSRPGGERHRHRWDDVGREDRRVQQPAARAIERSREAMQAAIATRDVRVIVETRRRIEAFYAECARAALIDCPDELRESSPQAAHLSAMQETTEAIAAIAVAREDSCPSLVERARREAFEACRALEGWMRAYRNGTASSSVEPSRDGRSGGRVA